MALVIQRGFSFSNDNVGDDRLTVLRNAHVRVSLRTKEETKEVIT